MNESVNGFLIFIISMIVAVLIATFGFTVYQSLKTSGSNSLLKVEKMNAQMDESEFTQYDGEIVSGTQVISVISNFKDKGVVIRVFNGKQDMKFYINPDDSAEQQKSAQTDWAAAMKNIKTRSNKYYITASAQYQGRVSRDAAGAIIELCFTKTGSTAPTAITEIPNQTEITAKA